MNKQAQANLVHALLVGIICGVVIAVYAALPIETPLYWACFIMIPVVFLFGGEWKDVPYHWANVLIGLFLGGALTFVITAQLLPAVGLAVAFGIATCVCTFLVQGLTTLFSPGAIRPFWGRCPMAFVGMITCFAAGGDNYLVAVVSLLVGVVTSTLMAQSGKLAAKIVGLGKESEQGEKQAPAQALAEN